MPRPAPYVNTTSQESSPNKFYVQWTSGSSGAVGTVSRSVGMAATPVTHGSTGVYTLSLAEPWAAGLLRFGYSIKQASYSSSGACHVVLTGDASTNLTTPTLTILVTTAAGAAVEPTTNDVIRVDFELQLQPNNAG